MFESFFSSDGQTAAASVQAVLLCLLSAYVLSQLVAWLYISTHVGVSYSSGMAQSIIVLSLLVAFLMLVIGNSVATAFGLFGALSLIRFRTPIKDARDTVYLFFSVAVGIAAGTQNLGAALVGTMVVGIILVYMHWARFGQRNENDGLVRMRLEAGSPAEEQVRKILGRFCPVVSLLHVRETGPTLEYAWQVRFYHPDLGPRMSGELTNVDGVTNYSLLLQNEDTRP